MSIKRTSPKTDPAPTPMPEAERQAIAETLGSADHHDLDVLSKVGGYSAVLADPKQCKDLEDLLESLITQRGVNVRNALRELGWATPEGKPMGSTLHKGTLTCDTQFKSGPSGHNVVSYAAVIREERKEIARLPDRLDTPIRAFAQAIDDAAHGRTPAPALTRAGLEPSQGASSISAASQRTLASGNMATGALANLAEGPEVYRFISPLIHAAVADAFDQVKAYLNHHCISPDRDGIRECPTSRDGFMATQDGGWIAEASFLVEDLESTTLPLPAVILTRAQEYRDSLEEDSEAAEDAMTEPVTFEVTGMVFAPDNRRNIFGEGQWEIRCFASVKYGETYMVTSQPGRSHIDGPDISIPVDPAEAPVLLIPRLQDAFLKAVAWLSNAPVAPLKDRISMEERLATGQLVELTEDARHEAKEAREHLKAFRIALHEVDSQGPRNAPPIAAEASRGGLLPDGFNDAAEALRKGLEHREFAGNVPTVPSLREHLNVLAEALGRTYSAHTMSMPQETPFTKALGPEQTEHLRDLLEAVRLGVFRSAVSSVQRAPLSIQSSAITTEAHPDSSMRDALRHRSLQTVTADHEMECYVIDAGSHVSTLGFTNTIQKANAVAAWLGREDLKVSPELYGTADAFLAYQDLMSAGSRHNLATGKRCEAELSPQLTGLEGKRVEVETTYGEKRRFWVGKSTGWMPCHLEIHNRRSTGGMAAEHQYKSVRVVADGPR